MSKVKTIAYRDIKLTRDMVITENTPIEVKTIFNLYNKNGDNCFNDEEWAIYEKALQKQLAREQAVINAKSGVVDYYADKLIKVSEKYNKVDEKWNSIDWTAVSNLEKFEKEHPEIVRNATNKKADIPKGAVSFDAQAWECGVYDEEKDCFTGEICKYGYVIGLEKLSDEERKDYLQLLKDANKTMKESEKCRKQYQKLGEEIDFYTGLGDMAKAGLLSKVGSREFEQQAYQQYVQIRNEANPFYREIRTLEQKRQALWLKGKLTVEDEKQIKQYDIQIQQLQQASQTWSVADADSVKKVQANGFAMTDMSEQVSFSTINYKAESQDLQDTQVLTDTHSIGAMYNGSNLKLMGNFTKAEKYTFKPEKKFENTYNAMLMASYNRQEFSISSNSMLNADNSMLMYNQSLGFGYKKFKINVNESIQSMTMPMPNEKGEVVTDKRTTCATTAGVEHSIGNFTNNISATFVKDDVSFSAGTNAMIFKNFGKGFSYNITPALNTTYSIKAKMATISPSINTGLSYQGEKGFGFSLNVNENYSASVACNPVTKDSGEMSTETSNKVLLNHNLTVAAAITPCKGLTGTLRFNDNDCSSSHLNTYGLGISYSTEKAGSFGIEYSYTNTTCKQSANGNNGMNLVSFKYTAPLGWARSKRK